MQAKQITGTVIQLDTDFKVQFYMRLFRTEY